MVIFIVFTLHLSSRSALSFPAELQLWALQTGTLILKFPVHWLNWFTVIIKFSQRPKVNFFDNLSIRIISEGNFCCPAKLLPPREPWLLSIHMLYSSLSGSRGVQGQYSGCLPSCWTDTLFSSSVFKYVHQKRFVLLLQLQAWFVPLVTKRDSSVHQPKLSVVCLGSGIMGMHVVSAVTNAVSLNHVCDASLSFAGVCFNKSCSDSLSILDFFGIKKFVKEFKQWMPQCFVQTIFLRCVAYTISGLGLRVDFKNSFHSVFSTFSEMFSFAIHAHPIKIYGGWSHRAYGSPWGQTEDTLERLHLSTTLRTPLCLPSEELERDISA